MKLLVLVSNYPHAGHSFSGIFNERSVGALAKLCDDVKVVSPRPFIPPLLSSLRPRWKVYSLAAAQEVRNGISVHRPAFWQIPAVGGGLCHDYGAFLASRGLAKRMHRAIQFDAILSFGVVGPGVMGWRIGRTLGIPSATWVMGHVGQSTSHRSAAARAIERSDLVLYQSEECREVASSLLRNSNDEMARDKHVVLPRGIEAPPSLPRLDIRKRIRSEWGIEDEGIVVISVGRIFREKGVFDLLDAFSQLPNDDAKITCVLVGSLPAFDETAAVQSKLDESPVLKKRVRLLAACDPDRVWEYLCAADIFVFASHHEGMPNSLLEAMAMSVPSVAFGIPPVLELDSGTGALLVVPPFNTAQLAHEISYLATSRSARAVIGERGKTRVMSGFMVQKNMARALDQIASIVRTHEAHGATHF